MRTCLGVNFICRALAHLALPATPPLQPPPSVELPFGAASAAQPGGSKEHDGPRMVAKQWGNILAHGQGPDRGILTIDVDAGTSLTWENRTNGKKLEVSNESIWEIYWRNYPSGCKLTLVLDAGAVALFTGFKSKVRGCARACERCNARQKPSRTRDDSFYPTTI